MNPELDNSLAQLSSAGDQCRDASLIVKQTRSSTDRARAWVEFYEGLDRYNRECVKIIAMLGESPGIRRLIADAEAHRSGSATV